MSFLLYLAIAILQEVTTSINIVFPLGTVVVPPGGQVAPILSSVLWQYDRKQAMRQLGPVHTVPTFNSCTKYVGSPRRMHDRTPDCHTFFLGFDACMTSQLNVALIRKLHGPLKCLAYFLDVSFMVFVQPGTGRRPVDGCRN